MVLLQIPSHSLQVGIRHLLEVVFDLIRLIFSYIGLNAVDQGFCFLELQSLSWFALRCYSNLQFILIFWIKIAFLLLGLLIESL